jgi:hypothetical protein
VTFTVTDAAQRRPAGVLLFDGFASPPPNGDAYVDADRLVVTGPAGTVVTRAPSTGAVDGNRIVWTRTEDDWTYSPQFGRTAVIAFAPDAGAVSQVATAVAVRRHSLSGLGPELRAYALGPAALLGLVAAGLVVAGRRLAAAVPSGRTVLRWLGVAAGGYVAVTALGALVGGSDVAYVLGFVGGSLAVPTFLTVAVALLTDRLDVGDGQRLTTVAAVAVAAWTLLLVLAAPASAALVLTAGPLVFLPFGVLAARGHPLRGLCPVVAALGPLVAALPLVPRVGVVFVSPAMFAAVFVGSTLLGVVQFAVGWRLAQRAAATSTRGQTGVEAST